MKCYMRKVKPKIVHLLGLQLYKIIIISKSKSEGTFTR